jgi:DNA modification methylase
VPAAVAFGCRSINRRRHSEYSERKKTLILQADARAIPLKDSCVQCVVTSPPYWGLRKYSGDQGAEPYGLEPTIEEYIAHTVEILREIRRVLRPDGVVFWNIGDSYASGAYSVRTRETPEVGKTRRLPRNWYADANKIQRNGNALLSGLKPKDLCLIPARVAIAAQADGWWIRSLIIWAKPNPMPESCQDRPTNACEHIIMLTKSERYYWDADAVREPATGNTHSRGNGDGGPKARDREAEENHVGWADSVRNVLSDRNIRNVWTFPTQPYKGAHFATFPEELPRRCILAATSERGCCATCGAPHVRMVSATGGTIGKSWHNHESDLDRGQRSGNDGHSMAADLYGTYKRETIGWKPGCGCSSRITPCIVLDPFGGSGTTARVAVELNRRAVSMDLAYHDHAEKRTRNVQRNLAITGL